MITSIPPSEWSRRLREFTARNACRQTTWERSGRFADREVGAPPADEAPFLGASYDPWDGSLRLMVADASGIPYYRTTDITDATSVEISTDASGRETGMRIERPAGDIVLRFAPRRFDPPRWSGMESASRAGA